MVSDVRFKNWMNRQHHYPSSILDRYSCLTSNETMQVVMVLPKEMKKDLVRLFYMMNKDPSLCGFLHRYIAEFISDNIHILDGADKKYNNQD